MNVTKSDINKMVIKESDNKKQEGAVYSTKKGKTDFHPIGSLEVKDNITLVKLLDEIVSHNQELLTKVKTLKDVIMNQEQRIQNLEKVVANYVG
jgi:hypothetical protein